MASHRRRTRVSDRHLLLPILVLAVCMPLAKADEPLTADAVMARVAANQDSSEKLRSQYLYQQHVQIIARKTNGKVVREEAADYQAVPKPDHTDKTLQQVTGRYWHKGKYETIIGEADPETDGIDGELIHDFREDLINEKSKDGLARGLFPLTTDQQKDYKFRLMDQEPFEGRPCYHIAFTPKDDDETDWAGEAYIDAQEFQPMYVFTKLARRLPFGVRTFLGTDLPGVGFAVHYRRQEDGVWFPISLGSEFRIRALFVFNRNMTISLENRAFEHTHVQTKIVGATQ
jgi:hypothetical protein